MYIAWQAAESLNDRELSAELQGQGGIKLEYKMPDYDYVHRELAKPGVTQQLLWFEYCGQCRDTAEVPYQLAQFKKCYRDYVIKKLSNNAHQPQAGRSHAG